MLSEMKLMNPNNPRRRTLMKGLVALSALLMIVVVTSKYPGGLKVGEDVQRTQLAQGAKSEEAVDSEKIHLDCMTHLTTQAASIGKTQLANLAQHLSIAPDAIFGFTGEDGNLKTVHWSEGVATRGDSLNIDILKQQHKMSPKNGDLRVVYKDNTVVLADLDRCVVTGLYEATPSGDMDERVITEPDEMEQLDDSAEEEMPEPTVEGDIAFGTHPGSTKNFPWTVRVGSPGSSGQPGVGFCSGVIISREFVVTSRHCTTGRPHDGLEFVAGTHKIHLSQFRQIQRSKFIWRHPKEDIALVRISGKWNYNDRVNKIPRFMAYKSSGMLVYAAGFGVEPPSTSMSNKFKHATMFTKSDCYCEGHSSHFATGKEVCCKGGSGNTCPGDSGGPLMFHRWERWNLLGINSWSSTSCSNFAHNVDVFESMVYLHPWVLDTMGKFYGWSNVVVYAKVCKQAKWKQDAYKKSYKKVATVIVRCLSGE